MKRIIPLLLAFLLCLVSCLAEEQDTASVVQTISLTVNGTEVPVIWEDNPSVQQLREHLPLTISTTGFGGLQKVGYLEQKIQDSDILTDAEPGDIILFEARWIMLFYGYHSGKYTRLGRIPADLTEKEMQVIAEDRDKTSEQLEEELQEAAEDKDNPPEQWEADLKKKAAKEFAEIEKETAKKTEEIRTSGLQEAEKQEKMEELKTQETEKKEEMLIQLIKSGKMKELLGGKITVTISAGE